MKRTIVLSSPVKVSYGLGQLVVTKDGLGHTIPMEDLAALVVENPQVTLTEVVLRELAFSNVMVIVCDASHIPAGIQLPLQGHTEFSKRAQQQIEMSVPLKKQLWKQVVVAKIGNQAQLLEQLHQRAEAKKMRRWALEVKSGDSDNREAVAAQYYWKQLLPNGVGRLSRESPPNPLFNYGYAIIRAAMSRSIVASGLLAVLGLHHKNKYNAFCLADDLMEPFRPFVDSVCIRIYNAGGGRAPELSKEERQEILSMLQMDTFDELGQVTSPLLVSIDRSTQSFVNCLFQEKRQLYFPALV